MSQSRRVPSTDSLRTRLNILGSIVIDAVSIAIWASITWLLNHFLSFIEIDGYIDSMTLKVFQWVFGFSTLVPIVAYTSVDIWRVLVRTYVSLLDIWERRNVYRRL